MLENEFTHLNAQIELLLKKQRQLIEENQLLQKKTQALVVERARLREKIHTAAENVRNITRQLKEQLS